MKEILWILLGIAITASLILSIVDIAIDHEKIDEKRYLKFKNICNISLIAFNIFIALMCIYGLI